MDANDGLQSFSSSGSENIDTLSPSLIVSPNLILSLHHKPRGSEGNWLPVEDGFNMRVSPQSGKNLRVIVSSRISSEEPMTLYLFEEKGNTQVPMSSKFLNVIRFSQLESNEFANVFQFEIKMFVTGTSVRLGVVRGSLIAFSILFHTHNTGKLKHEKSESQPTKLEGKKRSRVDIKREAEKSTQPTEYSIPQGYYNAQEPAPEPRLSNEFYHTESSFHHGSSPNSNSTGDYEPSSKRLRRQSEDLTGLRPPVTFQPETDDFITYMESPQEDMIFMDQLSSDLSDHIQRSDMSTSNISSNKPLNIHSDMNVAGVVKARQFAQYSDIRLKMNIESIVNALDIVSQLEGRRYQWIPGTPMAEATNERKVVGLIAQELKRVLPEVVNEDPVTGILSVNYAEIVPVLINAFNEQVSHEREFETDVRMNLDRLHEVTSTLSEDSKQRNVEKDIETMKLTVKELRESMQKVKREKRKKFFLPTTNRMRIIYSVVGALVALFTISILLAVFIPRGSTNDYSSNLLLNPSFEELDDSGVLAASWLPYGNGYSMFCNLTGSATLLNSNDTNIDPVTVGYGNQVLRLGSTAIPPNGKPYGATQIISLSSPPGKILFSATCNTHYITNTSTQFYVYFSSIHSESVTPWQVRLFFVIGDDSWQQETKELTLTETEKRSLIGFQATIFMLTTGQDILYCDNIGLRVL